MFDVNMILVRERATKTESPAAAATAEAAPVAAV
jgi:hypothetical protein